VLLRQGVWDTRPRKLGNAALAVSILDHHADDLRRSQEPDSGLPPRMPPCLPIFIVCQIAVVESDGSVQFHSDLYDRDNEIPQHLSRSQQPPLAQDVAAGQRKG
jgi:murein L,D-transpeptidase YcbB/YkuD